MSSRRRTQTAKASQLGDLSFDDWYETPVFEEEPDERLEQLATSKRAPLRLIGSTVLRLAPAPQTGSAREERVEEDAGAAPPDREAYAAALGQRADGDTRGDVADATDGLDLEADFESYCMQRTSAPERSWRRRAGRLLDRWADAEIASQARLEAMVLPRRWRS